jgi:hypothetical protein
MVGGLQVRDRCALYLAHLEGRAGAPEMVVPKLDVPLSNLEKALQDYLAGPMDAPFDVDTVDRVVEEPVVPMCAHLPPTLHVHSKTFVHQFYLHQFCLLLYPHHPHCWLDSS